MSRGNRRDLASGEVELVGVAEVATRLKVTSERVRQLARSGGMPDPIGHLGRQLVWRWQDIESWALAEGRLSDEGEGGRQPVRAWRQGPSGALNLVADEIFIWDESSSNACHVRVWAPPLGSNDPHVVLLGQLQNFDGGGVTNEIETVAMAVARKYLGTEWRRAQFYEYYPSSSLDDRDQFHHVTFAIKNYESRILHFSGGRKQNSLSKALGGELAQPSWRLTTREEIESVTGDTVEIWTPWTYTRELLEATMGQGSERPELTWDPERSRDLADLLARLSAHSVQMPNLGLIRFLDFDVELSAEQIYMASVLVAEAAESAKERAEQDVKTQPADSMIWSNTPSLNNEPMFFATAERKRLLKIDAEEIWQLACNLRNAIIAYPDVERHSTLLAQKKMLVPGLRGGWVTLRWYDAGIDEPTSEREGWCGPIALPSDLTDSRQRESNLAPIDQFLLLIDVLIAHLEEEYWEFWVEHHVPIFAPSLALSATGPLTRSYLSNIDWQDIDTIDQHRLGRIKAISDFDRAGLDLDGWLVVVGKNGKEFACEWPVSGDPDPTLKFATIRADRPGLHGGGATPVYIEHQDGRLHLLPAAGNRYQYQGNAFTWGYSGTGPSNLAAAIVDVLQRTDANCLEINEGGVRDYVKDLARSPRIPNWQVGELLRSVRDQVPGEAQRDTEKRKQPGSPT